MAHFQISDYAKDKQKVNDWIRTVEERLGGLGANKLSTEDVQWAVHTDSSSGAGHKLYLKSGIATVADRPVQGLGIPAIRVFSNLLGQSAAISTTTLAAIPKQGMFRVGYYIVTRGTGAAGTLTLTLGWTDPQQAQSLASAPVAVTATGNHDRGHVDALVAAASAITYSTAFSTNTCAYDLLLSVEELG